MIHWTAYICNNYTYPIHIQTCIVEELREAVIKNCNSCSVCYKYWWSCMFLDNNKKSSFSIVSKR